MRKYLVINLDGTLHPISVNDRERLKKVGARIFELKKYHSNIDNLLRSADAVLFTSTKIDSAFIGKLEKCRVIIRFGTGLDNIDVNAATQKGIMISRVVDFCTQEVSNHTLMLLLACSRKLKEFSSLLLSGKHVEDFSPMGSIEGQILGLIGFGKIAREVARKAGVFGLKVVAYDPYVDKSYFSKYDVRKASLNKLLTVSDYVSLHCPLNHETYHLIGEEELKLMKKTAYLINTSRGKLIDEPALIKALKNKWIAGAGLDVFEKEPPDKDNPLLNMENVICTAHYAYYSDRSIARLRKTVVDELIRVLSGKIPKNLYNPEVLKKIKLK
ncbi:MAG: C-terminal binding protein [Candidatus Omnitrophica bacterium]|nr:C-terminal binding protein [Candidatus Omnitrophota bacterium]MCM8816499.1 C-terminal binding protein [Candidatus Omnitrophota bacterium]